MAGIRSCRLFPISHLAAAQRRLPFPEKENRLRRFRPRRRWRRGRHGYLYGDSDCHGDKLLCHNSCSSFFLAGSFSVLANCSAVFFRFSTALMSSRMDFIFWYCTDFSAFRRSASACHFFGVTSSPVAFSFSRYRTAASYNASSALCFCSNCSFLLPRLHLVELAAGSFVPLVFLPY